MALTVSRLRPWTGLRPRAGRRVAIPPIEPLSPSPEEYFGTIPGVKNPQLQTKHAIQASELAEAVNAGLQSLKVMPGSYTPSLTAPAGPSTGGGVQSMQHLRLLPGDASLPQLLVGTANHAQGTAELRSYAYVDA